MDNLKYSSNFYENRHLNTVYSANLILSILLERIPSVRSAVDIGCGVGTWLAALKEKGIQNIHGMDGKWVDKNYLVIPQDCFTQVDIMTMGLNKSSRYDLAISLEVAEHLPIDFAKDFVLLLTELSDNVLFSAAIPFQGGQNHINEQWQHYWVNLFSTYKYDVIDFIRPLIWADENIPFWYKQNILFFSKRSNSKVTSTNLLNIEKFDISLDLIHPDLYLLKSSPKIGIRSSFKLLKYSIKNYISMKLKSDR